MEEKKESSLRFFTNDNVKKCLQIGDTFKFQDNTFKFETLDDALAPGGAIRVNLGVLRTLVQDGLPASYVRAQLDDNIIAPSFTPDDTPSNLIIIQYDTDKKGKQSSMRGIALCQVKYDDIIVKSSDKFEEIDDTKVTMKLLVLGNAKKSSVKLRDPKKIKGGSNIIKAIQFIGKNIPNGIELYALETVISYYWKFGWRFMSSCLADKPSHIGKKEIDKLLNFHLKHGDPNEYNTDENEKYEKILTNFNRFSDKFYKDLHHEGKEIATERAGDNGYRMLLCQDENPYSSLKGGKKKTKRRAGKTRRGRRGRGRRRGRKTRRIR